MPRERGLGLARQRAFDIAALRVLEQGRPSHTEEGRCQYRTYTPEGDLKCTIGWLIPDYRYRASFEDHAGGDMAMVVRAGLAPHLGCEPDGDDLPFLVDMRFAHDAASNALRYGDRHVFVAEFLNRMRTVATRHGVSSDCLERRRNRTGRMRQRAVYPAGNASRLRTVRYRSLRPAQRVAYELTGQGVPRPRDCQSEARFLDIDEHDAAVGRETGAAKLALI